jgi:hypothetical protein
MTDAMIDIETLGTDPDSVILTVGAVKFDPKNLKEPTQKVTWKLDTDEQFVLDRKTSESTLEWWGRQDPEIRARAFADHGRIGLDAFFKEFNKYVTGCKNIWCQGPQFDMVMIENLYRQKLHHTSWKYWQIKDSRTLFSLMEVDPRKAIQVEAHDAAEDAYWQAVCVQKTFKYFGLEDA